MYFFKTFCLVVSVVPLWARQEKGPFLEFAPKTLTVDSGEQVRVDAGRLDLPERRDSVPQQRISIPFYRLRSLAKSPGPPIFILTGGPGSSGLRQFEGEDMFKAIRFYRQMSDVVVFDQRGAGGSIPNLQCEGRGAGIPLEEPVQKEKLVKLFAKHASACRDHWLEQGVDLAAYNTDENAGDVNDLRLALGYEKIIVVGGSYGSHLGLHLLRKYPQFIDRAIFYGVEGLDHTYDLPTHEWNTYRRIAQFVEASGVYKNRLPKGGLLAAFQQTIERLKQKPVRTAIKHRNKTYEVWITSEIVQMAGTRGAGSRNHPERWPEMILAMYEGDYSMAAPAALSLQSIGSVNAMKYMMDTASGVSAARRSRILNDPASEWLGFSNFDYLASEQVWPAEDLGDAFRKPVISDIPVLLIHGSWDTSTPIENAREVVAGLRNGHLIEVVGGRHGALFNLLVHWPPAKAVIGGFITGKNQKLPKEIALDPPKFPQQTAVSDQVQAMLWDACQTGNLGQVKAALAQGADVNGLDQRRSRTGRRPLNWAAWHGYTQIIGVLLEQGADINATNISGFTALHHAVENGSKNAVKVLLAAGADPQLANKKGRTPFQTAKNMGRNEILSLLR